MRGNKGGNTQCRGRGCKSLTNSNVFGNIHRQAPPGYVFLMMFYAYSTYYSTLFLKCQAFFKKMSLFQTRVGLTHR